MFISDESIHFQCWMPYRWDSVTMQNRFAVKHVRNNVFFHFDNQKVNIGGLGFRVNLRMSDFMCNDLPC